MNDGATQISFAPRSSGQQLASIFDYARCRVDAIFEMRMNLLLGSRVLFSGRLDGDSVQRDKRILESALLVVRWQRGDHNAIDEIVKLWERPLFYYLRRLTASEADAWELLQETWLKVLKSIQTIRDPYAFPALLYRIARNAAISRLRKPDFQELDGDLALIGDDGQDDPLRDLQNADQVHSALEQLPPAQREVLTLFFLQDLSLEEMSGVLEIPVGTVKSRLHYAKQSIRKILSQGDGHAGAI